MDDETAEAFEIYCKEINYWPSNGYELASGVLQALERYFDYEAFAKDLFLEGYSDHEGHIFADY